jgi:tetraacyldisaccharide 4'-kinase
VGIAADRAAAGRLIEKRFHPAVLLLDDGFQHWSLERSLNIVLLDALDPLGGGESIPLGRLREPPEALQRADMVVITRVEAGQRLDGVEALIRRYNAGAPIFRARVVAQGWRPREAEGPVAAFCGLGNPQAFWQTLDGLGIQPVLRREFGDHHRYSVRELRELAGQARARGAQALATTEKDMMNLPDGWPVATGGLEVVWLEVGMEVEGADELLARVRASIV